MRRGGKCFKLYSKHVDIISCKVRRIIVAFPFSLLCFLSSSERDFSFNREKEAHIYTHSLFSACAPQTIHTHTHYIILGLAKRRKERGIKWSTVAVLYNHSDQAHFPHSLSSVCMNKIIFTLKRIAICVLSGKGKRRNKKAGAVRSERRRTRERMTARVFVFLDI